MSVCCVVGGQLGSEGKGLIVSHVAGQYDHHVRVGAANAGHTFYTQAWDSEVWGVSPHWEKHVVQQIPVAAYANPDARCYIGPGAVISADILANEIEMNEEWRVERGLRALELIVDGRAHIIQPQHVEEEASSGLSERIGSTSCIAKEGIGAAQAARVMRDETCVQVDDLAIFDCGASGWAGIEVTDVAKELRTRAALGENILLEGTQGYGLSLTTGQFPYVTSRNVTTAGLLADVGMPPRADRVIMVIRSYPIRVAGNSGPFHKGSREISWEELGVDTEQERTTVTKKVRRVATLSLGQVAEAAEANGATEVAVTHADYWDPAVRDVSSAEDILHNDTVMEHLTDIDDAVEPDAPVRYVGVGPHHVIDFMKN